MIGDLQGDDAQNFIDVIHEVGCSMLFRCTVWLLPPSIDQALDLPDLPPRLRRKCLRALSQICGRNALLPKSLQIPLCCDRSGEPLYRGGYADVWKGEHRGCDVAVKVLRVYSANDFDKITSVGSRFFGECMFAG